MINDNEMAGQVIAFYAESVANDEYDESTVDMLNGMLAEACDEDGLNFNEMYATSLLDLAEARLEVENVETKNNVIFNTEYVKLQKELDELYKQRSILNHKIGNTRDESIALDDLINMKFKRSSEILKGNITPEQSIRNFMFQLSLDEEENEIGENKKEDFMDINI